MSLQHPPFEHLLTAGASLTESGHEWALGGSGLLFALGLADHVGDWDLQTDASADACEQVFAHHRYERFDANGCHADHKLTLHDAAVEIIIRFAFTTPLGVVRVPTRVSGWWREVPVASPEGWVVAYWLLGELDALPERTAKAERLLSRLAISGADAGRIAELLAQPLPEPLAERLRGLPVRD